MGLLLYMADFSDSHIEYVMGCMGKNTIKVRNINGYMLAVLFKVGSTIELLQV